MNQDAQGRLVPGTATGYTVSDDKLTYTFSLRDDAKWSNGDPVVAGDFVYAWKRAVSPGTGIAVFLVHGVDVDRERRPDHRRRRARGRAWRFLPLTTGRLSSGSHSRFPISRRWSPTPRHSRSTPAVVEAHGADWTKPENIVSNGAYVLTEHIPNERSVRERNPMYWDARKGSSSKRPWPLSSTTRTPP